MISLLFSVGEVGVGGEGGEEIGPLCKTHKLFAFLGCSTLIRRFGDNGF